MALFIVGAGGVGREAYEVALAAGIEVAGFLDDITAGTVHDLAVQRPDTAPRGARYVIAIADSVARQRLGAQLTGLGLDPMTLIHPKAVLASDVRVGVGCLVMAGAQISCGVVLGEDVQVHYNATVGHDARLDSRTSLFPGANVGGAVHLGEGATVGSGACVLQGISIGEGAVVGAGAVVTRDVEARTVVVGVPARKQ